MKNKNTVRIAITKGRIEEYAVKLFQSSGIDCDELVNKGRKLIFHDNVNNIDFVLVKGPDVLTYVDHGVVDIGIVGKDVLLEQNKNYYEVLDLKMGKCKFAIAGLPETNFYEGYNRKKIATKYPNVARNYFRSKGQDVEIIKIEGSVELAPILGLSDAILDLVETGNTLKENGLVVLEEVCDISARLVVNITSMKLKREEILNIVSMLQSGISSKDSLIAG
ncbi:MAG: ATP phosphoribosyltransferase [Clostridiaceae bacterium]